MSDAATTLTADETEQVITALKALRAGDLSVRLEQGPAADAYNEMAEFLESFVLHLSQFAHATAVDGDLGFHLDTGHAVGAWKSVLATFNSMNSILGQQLADVRRVADAVAEGDLSQKVEVAASGQVGELKESLNGMIAQLQVLKASVNRMMDHVKQMGLVPGQDASRN